MERFPNSSWERKVFSHFDATLSSSQLPFPCPYGVSGHKAGHLRFGFCVTISASQIAEYLTSFIPQCRTFGSFTSLVIFEKPGDSLSINGYHQRFWNLLNDVAKLDSSPWPNSMPRDIDNRYWEFCFHGEPIFVICNTPAHMLRQSRRSNGFMLTFQPRWVFNKILDTPENAIEAFSAVKTRLNRFDMVESSQFLGRYGDEDIRESKQYFLSDDNSELACPLKSLGEHPEKPKQLRFSKISAQAIQNLDKTIFESFPPQGSVEVQKDQPGKVHEWHSHETDETLIILSGKIKFCYKDGEKICLPGNVIHLPKGVLHSSIALDKGAVYLIAMQEAK